VAYPCEFPSIVLINVWAGCPGNPFKAARAAAREVTSSNVRSARPVRGRSATAGLAPLTRKAVPKLARPTAASFNDAFANGSGDHVHYKMVAGTPSFVACADYHALRIRRSRLW